MGVTTNQDPVAAGAIRNASLCGQVATVELARKRGPKQVNDCTSGLTFAGVNFYDSRRGVSLAQFDKRADGFTFASFTAGTSLQYAATTHSVAGNFAVNS